MKLEHWAVPITSLDGMLLGVELETRVLINGCRVLMGAGKESEYIRHVVYQNQLRMIQGKAAWFKEKGCCACSVLAQVHAMKIYHSYGTWLLNRC